MIRLLKSVSNESGMGVAETLVACAMAAIVFMGILSFVQHSYKSQRNLKATQDFNDYVSLAQLALDDVRACTFNFGTVDATTDGLTLPDVGNEMPIEILHYDTSGASQTRLTATKINHDSAGKDMDFTLKKTLRLKTLSMTAPGHYIARIVIQAVKTGDTIGASEITQGFPIYVITDTNRKILSCYGNYASGGLSDLQQKHCEILLGPEYFWNPKSNRCETRYETKCFPGGKTTATCDPATTLGFAGQACGADGYVDPVEPDPPKRTYTSGATRKGYVPGPYACDKIDDQTVRCDYASGVDISSATCSACCRVLREEVSGAAEGAL